MAGNEDLVTGVIAPEVVPSVEALTTALGASYLSLQNFINLAKSSEQAFSITANYAQLTTNLNNSSKAQEGLNDATSDFVGNSRQLNTSLSGASSETQKLAKEQLALNERIAENTQDINELTSTLKKVEGQFNTTGRSASGMRDEITRLRQENLSLGAQLEKTSAQMKSLESTTSTTTKTFKGFSMNVNTGVPILNQFINILERSVLRMIAWQVVIGAVTFGLMSLWQAITDTDDAGKKAQKSLDNYNESLKRIDENTYATTAKQIAQVEILLTIARSAAESMNVRKRAIDELQKKYPDYFGNLKQEAFLTGEMSGAVEKLNKALEAKALLMAAEDKLEAASRRQLDILVAQKNELKDTQKVIADLNNDKLSSRDINIKNRDDIAIRTEQQRSINAQQEFKKQLDDIKKQKQDLLDAAKDAAIGAGGLAVDPGPKDKKGRQTSPSSGVSNIEALNKAERELLLTRVKTDQSIQKEIVDNDKKSLKERLDAYDLFVTDELTLVQIEKVSKLKAKDEEIAQVEKNIAGTKDAQKRREGLRLIKVFEDDKLAIIADSNQNAAILTNGMAKKIEEITKSSIQVQIAQYKEGLEKQKEELERVEQEKLETLNAKYAKGLINAKKYAKARARIEADYNNELYNASKKFYDDAIKDSQDNGDAPEVTNALKASRGALKTPAQKGSGNKNSLGFYTDPSDQMSPDEKALTIIPKAIDLAKTLQDIKNQAAQQEINNLQHQIELINIKENDELASVANTVVGQQAKAAAISKIEATANAEREAAQLKQRQLARQQAEQNKAIAIAEVVFNTAVAIIKAPASLGPIGGLVFDALLVALGAAQIAKISSTPLPAYAEGVGNHPGGYAVVGDGGKSELVIEPGKRPVRTPSVPTLMNLAAGTTVLPDANAVMLHAQEGLNSSLMSSAYAMQILMMQKDNSNIKQAFAQEADRIVNAVKNIPITQYKFSNGELKKSQFKNGSWTHYLNSSNG